MTEVFEVVQSQQALFDELVAAAIDSEEIARSLTHAQGVDKSYLQQRCTAKSARLWKEVPDVAFDYDEAARRHARVVRRHPVLAVLRDTLTSTPLQYALALFGLLLFMLAWVFYTPGPLGVVPNYWLLVIAMTLVAGALGARLFVSRFSVWKRIQYVADLFVLPAFVLVSIVLFSLGVVHLVSMDELQRAGVAGQTGSTAVNLVPMLLVVMPVVRAVSEARWTGLARLPLSGRLRAALEYVSDRRSLLKNFVALFLLAGLLRTQIGLRLPDLALGIPNPFLLDLGTGVMVLSAFVAVVGLPLRPARLIHQDYVAARQEVSRQLTEAAILPLLRTEINKHTQVLDVEIDVREAPGLGQLSDPAYLVSTAAAARVETLLESMPGGSIGLAGSRGSGKSTLIESYCAGPRKLANSLATMVSAPVEYAPREFLLHLYAKICREVLGSRSDTDELDISAEVRRGRGRVRLVGVGLLLILVGVALMILYNADVRISAQIAWALVFVASGVVSVGTAAGVRRAPDRGLRDVAARRLEEIRFQQTFNSSWSGAVKVPLGLEATFGGGRGLTRQALNLPEIVDSIRDFLQAVAHEHPVVIGIDELDKMESETSAEQFLNEIKSIFGVRGCYFLVSVSEEAMSSFERRGLPFRDVFDSTFDEIVWFEPLTAAEAIASIDRRVLLMPVPFKQLCFALSGGLPRDLIRAARLAIDAQDAQGPTGLSRLATELVAQDVTRKVRAIGVAVRRLDFEPDVGRFLLTCSSIRDLPVDPGMLMRLIDELLPARGSRAHAESTTAAAGMFLKLVGELVCFLYCAATVLAYFDESADETRWYEPFPLHLLAQARQALSISTRVAWEGISSFRSSWNMNTITFPVALEPVPEAPHR